MIKKKKNTETSTSEKHEKKEFKKLKKQVLEHKKEIEKEDKKEKKLKKQNKNLDEEPTFFHYAVVLLILGSIFTGIYFGFEWYDNKYNPGAINNPNLKITLYEYPFKVNNQNFTIQFYNPITELEKSNVPIHISKEELLNTQIFYFIFNSDKSSNGQVTKVSGRLFPFLKGVYKFPLDTKQHIISSDNLTCKNSTIENKLIFFNSNSTTNEVTFNKENGCIIFKSTKPELIGTVGDKFFLEILNQ